MLDARTLGLTSDHTQWTGFEGKPVEGPCQGPDAVITGVGQDQLVAGSDGSAVLPVIDVGPLAGRASVAAQADVAGQIQAACRERGFFYVTGHGVSAGLAALGRVPDSRPADPVVRITGARPDTP